MAGNVAGWWGQFKYLPILRSHEEIFCACLPLTRVWFARILGSVRFLPRGASLQAEMLRAARLVVDTGLHTKGWTREQAIEYFRDVMPISEEEATVHIERYMVRPGQALSYKIGELKIQALRKRSEVALGDSFNLTDFHDLILAGGGMPLIILEARVEQWIESQIKN